MKDVAERDNFLDPLEELVSDFNTDGVIEIVLSNFSMQRVASWVKITKCSHVHDKVLLQMLIKKALSNKSRNTNVHL